MRICLRDSVLWRLGLALLLAGLLALVIQPFAVHAAPAGDDTVVYIVKPGDRLADIAARYNTSASAIMHANNLANADVIFPGQRLTIPGGDGSAASSAATSAGTVTATVVATSGDSSDSGEALSSATDVYHTVKLGDSLEKIGRAYGVSASALIQANRVANPNLLWVGQRLLIPAGGDSPTATPEPTAATPTPAPTVARPAVHEVQAGETLSQIAQRYDTTVAALIGANGLGSADLIYVGMRLTIPKPGAAVTYAGQATRFVASISQQRCWLYRGDTVIYRWVCSTGRSGWGTLPGSYRIQSKLPKAFGSTWNIWMPYWLGIYWAGASENGIHGLPWDAASGAQTWAGLVGTPITYGCVMLDNVNAKMLYDMAYIGMPVIITP